MNRHTFSTVIPLCLCMFAGSASASLIWFTGADSGSAITDASLDPLTASPDATIGDFLQLIFAPSGSTFDLAVNFDTSPDGIAPGSDNVVVDAAFFGRNTGILPTLQGLMQLPKDAGTAFNIGDQFIVRAWTEPASFFDVGTPSASTIPNNPMVAYGDSAIYTYQALDPADDEFKFDTEGGRTGWQASLAVVPEPSTFALFLVSLGIIGRRLRRNRG